MTSLHSPESARTHRFLRSVHLVHDAGVSHRFDGYILTEQANRVITEVLRGLRDSEGNRAWTITGPYGTGKSACALFLSSLLSEPVSRPGSARACLSQSYARVADALIRERLLADDRPLLPVLVSATRQSPQAAIAAGIRGTLRAFASRVVDADGVLAAIDQADDEPAVVEAVERTRDLAERLGYAGLVLVIDELGRVLEHAVQSSEEGEIQVLQDLAELAQRSGERPFVLIGVLHQAFGQYAALFDSARRDTWAKVQGRFRDIAFIEPPAQLLRLLAAAVADRRPQAAGPLESVVRVAAERAAAAGAIPSGMTEDEYLALATAAAPLHPVAFTALPYLFRRFAQNERSLFSYLSSLEPLGFRELAEREAPITLPDVFDYVEANLGAAIVAQPRGRRWAEAFDMLDRTDWLDARDQRVLKTVAVLAALGDYSHLQPREELIVAALAGTDADEADVRAALERLTRKTVLTFRRFSRTYRLWDGSDIDLEARLADARSIVAADAGLAATLSRHVPPRPLIARRHSYDTGALRYFETRYLDRIPAMDDLPSPDPATGADGSALIYLPVSPGEAGAVEAWATSDELAGRPDILIAVARRTGRLADVAIELRALHRVRETLPELRDDAVARRELVARLAEVEGAVGHAVQLALQPGSVRWFHAGRPRDDVRRPADLSRLVSEVADRLYHATPRVRNELINRRALSSAAAAGRRALIEAMLTRADVERLGIAGFPPEASMYASVLYVTGLHRRGDDGAWAFRSPPADDRGRMAGAWQALEEHIFQPLPEPVRVDMLAAALARPPYGVTAGVFPVLLAAFLLANGGEVALYREGAFVPEPGVADFEVLMRRPELFGVAGFRIVGARAAMLQRFARGLTPDRTPAVVPVTRALLRAVRGAPEHARRTRRLAATTLAVRDACERATSPERLLFVDLPAALGVPAFEDGDGGGAGAATQVDGFFERLNAALVELGTVTDTVITRVRDVLLQAAGLEAGAAGWERLRGMAAELAPDVTDPALAAFLRRCAADGVRDDRAALESALALLADRPPRSWSDPDRDQAERRARELGAAIRAAEAAGRIAVWLPLTPEEGRLKDSVKAELQDVLQRAGRMIPTRVLRAALLEVLERLDAAAEEELENDG